MRGQWRALHTQYRTARGNLVRYDPRTHCVQITLPQYHADASYEIPLARITTANDFCEWADHLLEKAWIDAELMGAIIISIDDAIGLRGLQ